VWIALAQGNADGTAVEQVLPRLEALVQFTDGLEHRLAADGLGGIAGTVILYRQLREALNDVSQVELARIRDDVDGLVATVADLGRTLEEIRRLKVALGA
jgi:hypothetical protein